MIELLDGACPHKTKGCRRKLKHLADACRGVMRWALGSHGYLHSNRELWSEIYDLVKDPGEIKVTDETGTAKSYVFSDTECYVLHWFSVMTDMPADPKKSKKPKLDSPILAVTLTLEQIAEKTKVNKRRLGSAIKCLAAMQLLLPVSTGHRGHPQYIASPHLGIIGRTAEIHERWLTQYPEPVIGDVKIVNGKSYPANCEPADDKWGGI
ncbi:hypothetical protein [Streptomyces sp. IMTB 1903]|uniref:hypothetical protein n=1 Tax=Streptomyces sp. IMTB 1903 TaxID=1776680 RepID=UPI000757AB1A|nr:hypothetical protein [Streptomyces sp. IMTB 1903]